MPASPLRQRLEAALREALRARDTVARPALRSALAAIDNATAVPPGQAPAVAASLHVADAVAGLGAGEAERRRLTEADIENIVRAEVVPKGYAGTEPKRGGWPVASRTDIHRSPSGST